VHAGLVARHGRDLDFGRDHVGRDGVHGLTYEGIDHRCTGDGFLDRSRPFVPPSACTQNYSAMYTSRDRCFLRNDSRV
jgi:hypothetical protein